MQLRDLSHPKNSKSLNESVASKYGYRLQLEKFTEAQLRVARDKLVAEIADFERSNSYDAIYENSQYQKNRAFLDVITQALEERKLSPGEEKKREKYVKGMKGAEGEFKKRYGKRGKEVMYATATKMAKESSFDSAMNILRNVLNEQVITEGEEEKAALIISSRDMVDKLTGWLEDVASLKAETLLELIDSIRDELGNDISSQFESTVKPSLEEVYACLEKNRQALANAVSILTGEESGQGFPGMGATQGEEPDLGSEVPALPEPEMDMGREKRESVEYSRKLGTLLTSKKK